MTHTLHNMIEWKLKDVSGFFGVEPERPHHEDSEFRFYFPAGDACAELCVFPFNSNVSLKLWTENKDEPLAEWHFDCVRIEIPAEREEWLEEADESDADLIIHVEAPRREAHPSAILRIARHGDQFSIHSAAFRSLKR